MAPFPAFVGPATIGRSLVAQAALKSTTLLQASILPPPDDRTSLVANSIHLATSTDIAASSPSSFEPILPSTATLVGMTSVVILCVVAAVVWNESVVPISRTKLAIDKRKGQVKEYLDELEESSENNDRQLETWLFTDWLQQRNSNTTIPKESALPILKKAKWNSGDNPVLVTSAIMLVGVLVASITERISM